MKIMIHLIIKIKIKNEGESDDANANNNENKIKLNKSDKKNMYSSSKIFLLDDSNSNAENDVNIDKKNDDNNKNNILTLNKQHEKIIESKLLKEK